MRRHGWRRRWRRGELLGSVQSETVPTFTGCCSCLVPPLAGWLHAAHRLHAAIARLAFAALHLLQLHGLCCCVSSCRLRPQKSPSVAAPPRHAAELASLAGTKERTAAEAVAVADSLYSVHLGEGDQEGGHEGKASRGGQEGWLDGLACVHVVPQRLLRRVTGTGCSPSRAGGSAAACMVAPSLPRECAGTAQQRYHQVSTCAPRDRSRARGSVSPHVAALVLAQDQ